MKRLFALLILVGLVAGLTAEQVVVSNDRYGVNVLDNSPDRTEMEFTFGSFDRYPVTIDGKEWSILNLPGENRVSERGMPELPRFTRALAIGGDALMEVHFIDGDYTDIQMDVIPSKGEIFRNVDPATVPWEFGEVYSQDAFWPAQLGSRDAPYIMRDVRGIAVHAYPFQYNPVSGTLRVWHRLRLEVVRVGTDTVNVKQRPTLGLNRDFYDIYSRRFLNYQTTRYDTLTQGGTILVICYPDFMDEMAPWVEWKTQKGFDVELVDVSTIGSTPAQIKDYVQDVYDDPDVDLAYLQLVGDAAQVPSFTYVISSYESGASDPTYSLLEGGDNYPDIFVGRFSAETEAQVTTQVERSVHYERDITDIDAEWLHKGMGVASSLGSSQGHYGEADYVHIGYIRDDLMGYTFTDVDEVYDNNGGNSTMVANGVNNGRSIINYCGHGSSTSWVSSGFNINNVNQLTNDYMLPNIVSVACVNGDFDAMTCYAESWMRATNNSNGAPTGAIAFYGSSVNQSWAPPMYAQDEAIDLLVGNHRNVVGSLDYNASSYMMDVQGNDGMKMFMTWHIFGDCSLQVRTDVPTAFAMDYTPALFIGLDTFDVDAGMEGAMVSLNYNGEILGRGYTDESGTVQLDLSNVPDQPCDLTLTVTGYNKITYVDTVQLLPNDGPYVMMDDPVFADGNNNVPEFGENLLVSVSLENVGSEAAYEAVATIVCHDEYIELLDATEDIGTINSEASIDLTDAFEVVLAGNIPDMHEVAMSVVINAEDDQGEPFEWTQPIAITAHAPNIVVGDFDIYDSSGNNNGQLDPGETVAIEFQLQNDGSCDSPEAVATLVCNNPYVSIQFNTIDLGVLTVDGTAEPTFIVSLSEDVPVGDVLPFGFGVQAGMYSEQSTVLQGLPAQIEDFEDGLGLMGWNFAGDAGWSLVDDMAYEGGWSLRSGAIGANEISSAEFTYNVTEPGDMVFYRNISSEVNHDYLRFYVDDVQRGQWSGLSQWLPITVTLTETGEHTFRWSYEKDGSYDAGSDCAWIDFISFPGLDPDPVPIIALSCTEIVFMGPEVNQTYTYDITVYNYGSQLLSGNIETPDGFTLVMPGERTRGGIDQRAQNRQTYSLELLPLESMDMTLVFQPTQEMNYSGNVVFDTNDPYVPEMALHIDASLVGNNDTGVTPYVNALNGNYPNPFNPETTVSFSLAQPGKAEIAIYNVRGQRVKTLLNEHLDAGQHSIVWKGDTEDGKRAASGVYFLNMDADDGRYTAVKKIILLK